MNYCIVLSKFLSDKIEAPALTYLFEKQIIEKEVDLRKR